MKNPSELKQFIAARAEAALRAAGFRLVVPMAFVDAKRGVVETFPTCVMPLAEAERLMAGKGGDA